MKKIVKIPLFIKNYLENLFNRAKTTKGMTNLEVEELSDKIDDFVERYKGTDTNQDRETVDKMVNELTSDFEPVVANAERFAGEADSVVNRPQGISALLTEGPERTFQFISERTGLDKGRIKRALIEMMNEGFSGPGKMTTIDDEARIFAFADVNLKDNPLEFMEEVEQIGKNIETDNVIDLEKFRKKEGIETLPTGKIDYQKYEDIAEQFGEDEALKQFQYDHGVGEVRFDPEKGIVQDAPARETGGVNPADARKTKEKAKKIIATEDPPDEFFGKPEVDMTPEEVDALKTDQFVDETMEVRKKLQGLENVQLTGLAGDIAKQVASNERKIAKLIEAGEFDKARELEKVNQKTLEVMSGEGLEDIDQLLDLFPFDPDKPKMAEGGRIGLQDGGGKFPISRRGFLGVLGGGITAALTGGKGLLPAAKTGITAAKTLSAPGMPKWFPLLVGKIQTKGNLISPAAPNKGEVNAVYKYKDGMTEYKMVEDVNTGRIDIYTTSNEGTQVSFEYEPSMKRYFEDGSSVTDEPSFFVGEFRKGHEGGADFENYAMGMDEVTSDIRNVEDFATRGTTMQVDDAIEDFIKKTRTEEPGFKLGGLVPPQAGPMSSGMGSLFRQRTA
tara:strand:- start:39 stop:1889 length:1851 start_codon:yes stop_codon:yes gene_type:complete